MKPSIPPAVLAHPNSARGVIASTHSPLMAQWRRRALSPALPFAHAALKSSGQLSVLCRVFLLAAVTHLGRGRASELQRHCLRSFACCPARVRYQRGFLSVKSPPVAGSTASEALEMHAAVATTLVHFASRVQGGALHYITDSQPLVDSFTGMKGKPGVLEIVRQIYDLAAASDVDFCDLGAPRV